MRLVIFDFDGLLVNTEEVVYQGLKKLFEKNNYELHWEYYCKYIGMSVQEALPHYFQDFPITQTYDEFVALRDKVVADELKHSLQLMPGARELLTYLKKQGVFQVVASSGRRQYVKNAMNRLCISEYFSDIITSDDVSRNKPYPDIFLKALDRTKCSAKDALVIEDAPHGITAAYRAGIKSVAVPTKGLDIHFFSNAYVVASSLFEVKELFSSKRIQF